MISFSFAAHNAAGEHRNLHYDAVPGCIYSVPEIACVGMTEEPCFTQTSMFMVVPPEVGAARLSGPQFKQKYFISVFRMQRQVDLWL